MRHTGRLISPLVTPSPEETGQGNGTTSAVGELEPWVCWCSVGLWLWESCHCRTVVAQEGQMPARVPHSGLLLVHPFDQVQPGVRGQGSPGDTVPGVQVQENRAGWRRTEKRSGPREAVQPRNVSGSFSSRHKAGRDSNFLSPSLKSVQHITCFSQRHLQTYVITFPLPPATMTSDSSEDKDSVSLGPKAIKMWNRIPCHGPVDMSHEHRSP